MQVLKTCKYLGRYGKAVGKRKLSATFGIGQADLHTVLRASGQTGTTYEINHMGARTPVPDDFLTVLYPEGHNKTLADAYAETQRLGALGAVKHEKTNAIGLRIIRDPPPG